MVFLGTSTGEHRKREADNWMSSYGEADQKGLARGDNELNVGV